MKKTISVLLSLVMVLLLAVPAFAAEDRLVFMSIGDSIAKGSGLVNQPQACYTRIICDTNNYEYINEGVDGNTSSDVLARVKTAPVQKKIAKADIIDISVGGNDYLRSNPVKLVYRGILLRDDSVFSAITEKYYENLCEIIRIVKEVNPDALIIMQTLYNPAPTWLSPFTEKPAQMLNDCIYRYLEENPDAFVVADIHGAFAGHPGYTELIHPNAEGNEVIAKEILELLGELGYESSTELVITKKGINSWEFYVAQWIGFMR